MLHIGGNIYEQRYYSIDYFRLLDVLENESDRLTELGVSILEHQLSVSEKNGKLIFYLHLYFRGNSNKELTYKQLFGNH